MLKIGPATSDAKWSAAEIGRRHAAEAGIVVPVQRARWLDGDFVVRLFEWVDGVPAIDLAGQPDAQARLGADLGRWIAALHSTERDGFSSRLDGSAPTFASWNKYLDDRIQHIGRRADDHDAPEPLLRQRCTELVRSLASDVSAECRPVVCHRDLHANNLLVDDGGGLVAILDWDMPEAWDAAGEWFKLESFLFAELPAARRPFLEAYSAVHGFDESWPHRVRLVHLIENLNVLSNAPSNEPSFTSSAIEALERLVE